MVKDFTYNEEELAAGKNELTKLTSDKKKQFVSSVTPRVNVQSVDAIFGNN